MVYQRIFAPLRNITFFSLQELNEAIWEKLERHNNAFFQRRNISRRKLFEQIEKEELQPLPVERYELKHYQIAKVEFNYHAYLKEDKHYYSVPYQYIGKRIKIIYTARNVEIYKDNILIALHRRNRRNYGYTTIKKHLPPEHQFVNGWSPDKFIRWAATIGGSVKEFIRLMLDSREHPEQAFKSDLGLRPNYHQLEQRIDARVFITVLAYHLLHAIEYILTSKGCKLSWRTVKRIVSSQDYTTITLPTTSGPVIHLRKPGIPEQVHLELYEKLEVDYKKLETRKIIA
ncbi:hypothetical protein ES708_23464 [subsurface metagenome]